MSIKTILVYLAPDADCFNRLDVAIRMAQELKGHLVCLYVAHPLHVPSEIEGRGASLIYLSESVKNAKAKLGEVKAKVEEKCNAAKISYEWFYGEEEHLLSLLAVVHHVDLTIVSRIEFTSFEDRLLHNFVEELIMKAGGPVLMLPKGKCDFSLKNLRNIMIAWNSSTESIRAVRDYLEILRHANQVHVFVAKENHDPKSISPIRAYLKRQGIDSVECSLEIKGHAGDEILEAAQTCSADAVLMGAYGRNGIIDRLLGNASRWVVSHAEVPLLLSH